MSTWQRGREQQQQLQLVESGCRNMGIAEQNEACSTRYSDEGLSECTTIGFSGEKVEGAADEILQTEFCENFTKEVSLQDAFLKFKKTKQKKFKKKRSRKKKRGKYRSEEVMCELRKKFVEQAKKYLGVPYARKYHELGSSEYDAPLFLDCCGLVRRVLHDLSDDFGFEIGPWNQAYMFDTLPNTIKDVADMKAGDLVFVSGVFYNPEMKKQRHNMVHVEIWAGDGEKTIGARWKKGRLQIHDSYKYVSKTYHSMVYYFRSIDTWLKGICKSFCPEHKWKLPRRFKPSKKSIFAAAVDQDSQNTACGDEQDDADEDENEDVGGAQQGERCTTCNAGTAESCEGSWEADSAVDGSEVTCDWSAMADYDSEDSSGDVDQTNEMWFLDEYDENEDVVCHPNSGTRARSNRQTGRGLGTRTYQTAKGSSEEKRPNDDDDNDDESSDRRPKRPLCGRNPSYGQLSQRTRTFFIGGHNGAKMVEATLTSLGWKRILDGNDRSFFLKWVECKKNLDFGAFREGEQLVNHISNINLLTTKIGLLTSLQEFERVNNKLEPSSARKRFRVDDFFPETYKLQCAPEIENFMRQIYQDGEIWICKPTGMNQGKGIYLIRNQTELEKRFGPKLEAQNHRGIPSAGRVVQRYISNPLLLKGFKSDIRTYMLIAGTSPYMVFYHPGYVRLSVVPYSLNHEEMHAHLTNQYVQKKHPLYQELKEETVWSLDKFQEYINEAYNSEGMLPQDWVFTVFTKRMQEIMLKCFESVRHKLHRKLGYFDLLGFDFMLDENFKVWLIEININPALHTNCMILSEVIPELVDSTLKLVIEVFEKSKNKESLSRLENLGKFQLLYNGSKK